MSNLPFVAINEPLLFVNPVKFIAASSCNVKVYPSILTVLFEIALSTFTLPVRLITPFVEL